MNDMIYDKTDTKTFEMEGKCPFGGDRIGGTLGAPPQLSEWYPNRLKVELLHQNGPQWGLRGGNAGSFVDAALPQI